MLVFFNTSKVLASLRTAIESDNVTYCKSLFAKYLNLSNQSRSSLYTSHNQIYDKTDNYMNWKYVLHVQHSEELMDKLLDLKLSQNDILIKIIDNEQDFLESFKKQFFIYDQVANLIEIVERLKTYDFSEEDFLEKTFENTLIDEKLSLLILKRKEDLNNILKYCLNYYASRLSLNHVISISELDLDSNILTLKELRKTVVQNIRKLFI